MKKSSLKRKTAKFFKYFFIIFIAALLVLYIIGNLAEKRITALAFNELKSSIEVPIESGDISFTLIKRFPLATFEFNNIRLSSPTVMGEDTAMVVSDTLIRIGKLYVSVKSTPLVNGVFDIQKIEVVGANIDYRVDKRGISSFDFLIDTTQTEGSDTIPTAPLDLTLQKLLLKDITCYYSDSLTTTRAKITIPEINLNGKIKKDIYSGFVEGSVVISESDFKDTYLDKMRETKIEFELGLKDDSLTIDAFNLITDGAKVSASGSSVMRDKIYADVSIKGESIDLAELMKYVPEDSTKKYNIEDVKGNISFDASIKGVISDSIQPRVEISLSLNNGEILTSQYPTLKNMSFVVNATNGEQQNEETTKIDVRNFRFNVDSSDVDFNGTVENLKRPRYKINSEVKINIPDFRQLIPDSLINEISGVVKAHFSTKGILPDSIDDNYYEYLLQTSRAEVTFLDVNMKMDSIPEINSFSGYFNYQPQQLDASGVNISLPDYRVNIKNSSFNSHLSGKLLQPEDVAIDITSFSLNSDSSHFSGKASVKNLNAPLYSINSKIELNLNEMKGIVPDSLISDMSGVVTSTITSSGELNLDSIAEQINDIVFEKSSFTFGLNNISVAMPDTMMCIDNLTGSVKIIPDTIFVDNLTGRYKAINFDASKVKVVNLYNTFFKNMYEQLYVEGAFHLGDINYETFAPFVDTTSTATEEKAAINKNNINNYSEDLTNDETTNYTFLIKGKLSVNSFKYEKANFENISALFNLKDSIYTIDKLTFDAFKGRMNSSIRVELKNTNEMQVNTKHFVENMDIKQLLEDFEDFSEYGNSYIKSDNLNGILSTELYTQSVFIDNSLLMNKTRVKGVFKLENGGIYNYKPAMDMADFTNLKELDSIRFKTLESKIFMFKNKLYVPKTNIVSSALDVSFFGMQSMGDDYEYHISLHLGDVLKGKSKKLLKRQAETGEEITDDDLKRGTVKLIYSYIDGKSKVGFDSKKALKMMSLKIKVQQKMLDLIFNPKVVSFSTDVN